MTPSTATAVRRLNWGCGGHTLPGWINSDQKDGDGIDLTCDIAQGLPLESGRMDYVVSIHALPEVPYDRQPGQAPRLNDAFSTSATVFAASTSPATAMMRLAPL